MQGYSLYPAPPLSVSEWLNTDKALTLEDLRGRVVVIEAFQMLCPGCVSYGIPQTQRIARHFARDPVTVIGLHAIFEHHEAQGSRVALEAFAHEYKIRFPLAIDKRGGYLPQTMEAYDSAYNRRSVVGVLSPSLDRCLIQQDLLADRHTTA